MSIEERAEEISTFLGLPIDQCRHRLSQGFGFLHDAVKQDFNQFSPQNDTDLLRWYATTESYIWELSAYHEDAGFNYSGMIGGIVERLKSEPNVHRVLCLGDGIGDLSLTLHKAGLETWYHDLSGSKTEAFARFRFARYGAGMNFDTTHNWRPQLYGLYDAIVSLDFFEHLTDLQSWMAAVRLRLKPGGYLVAQNAFNCGSGPEGSIPCHLQINDIYAMETTKEDVDRYLNSDKEYERAWGRLLAEYAPQGTDGMSFWLWTLIKNPGGFSIEPGNWYRRE
jgi:hypothetical protein